MEEWEGGKRRGKLFLESGFKTSPINEEEEVGFLIFISVPRY